MQSCLEEMLEMGWVDRLHELASAVLVAHLSNVNFYVLWSLGSLEYMKWQLLNVL